MKKIFALLALVTTISAFAVPQDPPMPIQQCEQQMPYGIPQVRKDDSVQICRKAYALEYDNKAKIPVWVSYMLTPEHTTGCVKRSNAFSPDLSLRPDARSTLRDYNDSGYDTGHIANNADMSWDTVIETESFILSNMTPQLPGFNRGIWKRLEDQTRALANARNHPILVYAGLIYRYDDPTIGPNRVIIPSGFYKILIDVITRDVLVYEFKHRPAKGSLDQFIVELGQVQQHTQIQFPMPPNARYSDKTWPSKTRSVVQQKRNSCSW